MIFVAGKCPASNVTQANHVGDVELVESVEKSVEKYVEHVVAILGGLATTRASQLGSVSPRFIARNVDKRSPRKTEMQ